MLGSLALGRPRQLRPRDPDAGSICDVGIAGLPTSAPSGDRRRERGARPRAGNRSRRRIRRRRAQWRRASRVSRRTLSAGSRATCVGTLASRRRCRTGAHPGPRTPAALPALLRPLGHVEVFSWWSPRAFAQPMPVACRPRIVQRLHLPTRSFLIALVFRSFGLWTRPLRCRSPSCGAGSLLPPRARHYTLPRSFGSTRTRPAMRRHIGPRRIFSSRTRARG